MSPVGISLVFNFLSDKLDASCAYWSTKLYFVGIIRLWEIVARHELNLTRFISRILSWLGHRMVFLAGMTEVSQHCARPGHRKFHGRSHFCVELQLALSCSLQCSTLREGLTHVASHCAWLLTFAKFEISKTLSLRFVWIALIGDMIGLRSHKIIQFLLIWNILWSISEMNCRSIASYNDFATPCPFIINCLLITNYGISSQSYNMSC